MKSKGPLFGGSYKDSAKIGMLLLLFTVSLAAPGDRQPLGATSGGDDAFSSLVSSVFEAFEGGLNQHVTPFYQKARADPLLSKMLFVFFALFLVKVFLFDFVSCLFCGCRKVGFNSNRKRQQDLDSSTRM